MKPLLLSLITSALLANELTLQEQIEMLKSEITAIQSSQEETTMTLIEEISTLGDKIEIPQDEYKQVTGLGPAASKIYNSKEKLSIGGYGEMYYRRYSQFNNGDASTNKKKTTPETNILRFIPYFGFKFNDWIIMNTEVEWENGGAKPSDTTGGYNYSIIEFTYIDFLLDSAFNIRVGHLLVPMGNINLNHEPTQFFTSDRPTVEKTIIPSTWHTNGILAYGTLFEDYHYHGGFVTSPDARNYEQGSFIKRGRLGGKQVTGDLAFSGRIDYTGIDGLNIGSSLFYGNSGSNIEDSSAKDHAITLYDVHANYRAHGWDIKALYTAGSLGDNALQYSELSSPKTVASSVNGAYLAIAHNILPYLSDSNNRLLVGFQIEHLNMDAKKDAVYSVASELENQEWNEYTYALNYFPDPNFVIKADLKVIDYRKRSLYQDEILYTMSVGYIF
jgi:hypothetical protein